MHDLPMQTGRPNGVRSSDWLGPLIYSLFYNNSSGLYLMVSVVQRIHLNI